MTDIVLKAGGIVINKTDNPALEALSDHGRERLGFHPSQSLMFLTSSKFSFLFGLLSLS